jgi:NADH dehydrogenase FAD-containing subunit
VLATGATHGYFGREEWAVHAPGLKSVPDATSIRSRILDAFEKAEATEDAVAQRKLLTFLICGAGPTGVEMAGAIAELARNGVAKDFRNFDPASARILLVQAGPRILPQFDARLSAFARTSLEALGVEVHIDSRVELIDGKVTGAAAWWLWGAVHVFFLAGLRNRLSVMLGWVWSYFTFDVGARLITAAGETSPRRGD